jgi:AbrB family looped-hinge helix DNA binding protein
MDVVSRMTSKGQVTVPKAVRDALGLKEGDRIVFRVAGERAEVARSADLLELAGTVTLSSPAPLESATGWDEVRRQLRRARARQRR